MKGMNISRNAFIGEINSQDIAAEREQPHNGAKKLFAFDKKTSPKGFSASKFDVGNWIFSKS